MNAPDRTPTRRPAARGVEGRPAKPRRGAFVVGLVIGLLLGLVIALGVALYITKTPVPFINKVPGRSAQQDNVETERNKNWDPNAPLATKLPTPAAASQPAEGASAASGAALPPAPAVPAAPGSSRDAGAILSGAPAPAPVAPPPAPPRSTAQAVDPFVYFVQAGAFTRNEDAEQQKARLALLGHSAKVSERDQAGRTVYRVRIGPFPTRDEADALQGRLQDAGVESQLVRVEKQ